MMNRLKALYRSWAIPCAGQRVYAPRYRSEWLAKITEAGVHRRAEIYYQQFDALRSLREQVRRDLLAEGRKHSAIEIAAPDSFDWTHSSGSVDCSDADAASFSHQAPTVGLLWLGIENLHQRGIPLSCRDS